MGAKAIGSTICPSFYALHWQKPHGSGAIFIMGSIKNLFSGLFGIIVTILKLPITLITLPLKLLSSGKDKGSTSAPKANKKSNGAFYLEMEDAKGFVEPAPKAEAPAKAKATQAAAPATAKATNASALNLPQPTVTTTASEPEISYSQFGSRRGPGANMKSYLDMAKTIKNA
jgi:hypothetical protein